MSSLLFVAIAFLKASAQRIWMRWYVALRGAVIFVCICSAQHASLESVSINAQVNYAQLEMPIANALTAAIGF